MKTIAFLNRKGGVGKTSCCHHLAGALAESGYKVLLVDNDPQASLSSRALPGVEFAAIGPDDTLAGIYAGDPRPAVCFARSVWPGVDLVVGSARLDGHNVAEPWTRPRAVQVRLADALLEIAPGYDLALVDCPPNLLGLSWSALLAADGLVVPLQPEDYGAMGAPAVLDFAGRAGDGNPGLALLGLLVTMRDGRSTLHAVHEEQIRAEHGDDVFAAVVPRRTAYASAITERKPITRYDRTGPAARAIREVAGELLDRLGAAGGRGLATAGAAGKGVVG